MPADEIAQYKQCWDAREEARKEVEAIIAASENPVAYKDWLRGITAGDRITLPMSGIPYPDGPPGLQEALENYDQKHKAVLNAWSLLSNHDKRHRDVIRRPLYPPPS
jgi:hypothetical protein